MSPVDDLRDDRELAASVAAGDVRAVETFERRFRPELRLVAMRLGAKDDLDELVQVLLTRLLVGTRDAPARIASYRGEGSLRSWVRAVSTRFVIDHLRSAQARAPVDPLSESGVARSAHIEGGVEDRRFGEIVRTAVEAAFAELTPRQRNLLRHATFSRLTIDELGVIYRVHRTTAARWLQRTRTELQAAIAAKIAVATGMATAEAHSVLRNVAPDADLSLRSMLPPALEDDTE